MEDVLAFLHNLGEEALVFGCSAGGMVALGAAARAPEAVRALLIGDSPIDIPQLLARMTSDGFAGLFSSWRDLAALHLPPAEMAKALLDLPIQVSEDGSTTRYGDRPGVDPIALLQCATALHDLDPGVLEYHAEGRGQEFLEGFDLDVLLTRITCPVLLLQANPSLGGMMTDQVVDHVLAKLPTAAHVLIDEAGHNQGLNTWEVAPLLTAVTGFLEVL